MNLLITGGLGSIGLEIIEATKLRADIRIVTLSRNVAPPGLSQPGNATHEVGSLLDEARIAEVLRSHEISHIVHAAGARTSLCENDPLAGFENNVQATDYLLRAARDVQRVVFLSSAAVYGKVSERIDESFPIAPQTNYAITKAAAEICVAGHGLTSDVETIIVRPGFVVGTGSVSKLGGFIRSVVSRETIEIDFVERFFLHWSPDLGRAIAELLVAPVGTGQEIFHLPGRSYSLENLASTLTEVAHEFGFHPKITTKIDESLAVPADLDYSRIKAVFEDASTIDLAQICRELIRHETVTNKAGLK